MAIPARTDAVGSGWSRAGVRLQTIPLETWILGAVIAIGAVLRFTTLGSQSLWSDEASVVHQAKFSFATMFSSDVSNEANPPLYFVLSWVWVRLFGSGEVGIRSLSALAGTAAIPIAYLAGRDLVSKRAGLAAALLVALSPFMIWYSQDATEYMFLAATSGLTLVFFARARRDPSLKNLVWWGLSGALALLTHFFAAFLIAGEAVWLLWTVRRRSVLVGAAPFLVAGAALIPVVVSHASTSLLSAVGGFITETPLHIRIEQLPVSFALGTLSKSTLINQGLLGAAIVAGILIVLLVIGADERELRGAGIAAALAACVVIIPLLAALAGHDYFIDRALIPAWIPLAIVVGAACTARRTLVGGVVFGAIVVAAFVYAQVRITGNPQYQRPDWRGVARALGSTPDPRAVVAYNGSLGTDPLSYYLPRVRFGISLQKVVSVREVDVIASIWQPAPRSLPSGTRLLSHRTVNDFTVDRFSVAPAWRLTGTQIAARAGQLLPPAPAARNVVIEAAAKP